MKKIDRDTTVQMRERQNDIMTEFLKDLEKMYTRQYGDVEDLLVSFR